FRPSGRLLRATVAGGVAAAAAVAAVAGLTALPAHAAGHAPAAASVKPGLTGPAITVANHVDLSDAILGDYDMATGPDGTSYLAWMYNAGVGRDIGFCKLPRGARACAGGVQTISAAPDPSDSGGASGLRVLVDSSNLVTLVWEHGVLGAAGAE